MGKIEAVQRSGESPAQQEPPRAPLTGGSKEEIFFGAVSFEVNLAGEPCRRKHAGPNSALSNTLRGFTQERGGEAVCFGKTSPSCASAAPRGCSHPRKVLGVPQVGRAVQAQQLTEQQRIRGVLALLLRKGSSWTVSTPASALTSASLPPLFLPDLREAVDEPQLLQYLC